MLTRRGFRIAGLIVAAWGVIGSPIRASETTLTLDPAATTVTFTLAATAHTVEGILPLDSGTISFDPVSGSASGTIVVRLERARTGNERRDRKMHDDVLETATFPVAVFRPERIAGSLLEGVSSKVAVHGMLSFHGAERPLTLEARVERRGDRFTADVAIRIPYVAWGAEDPSAFVLRVAKVVDVHVKAVGRIAD